MIREGFVRTTTHLAIALISIVALTCVASAVQTFKVPSASLTTYSLNPGATKVLSPSTGTSVLIMASCKDAGAEGVCYVNVNRTSGGPVAWEGQHSGGVVTAGSSSSSGTLMANVDSTGFVRLETSGT